MKNKRRTLGIVAAVLCAIIGTVALVGYVNSAKNKAEAKEALTNVYVVDEVIPKGADAETVKASVSVEKVPNRLVQPGAITNLEDVDAAKIAATDLQPGDQLLTARLALKNQVDPDVTDKVQVSAQLTPERAVGGTLQKGDTVGVYLSFPPFDTNKAQSDTTTPDKTPNTTHLEFQHVAVTNIQATSEPVLDDKASTDHKLEQVTASQYIVTLALTPAESERFVYGAEFGKVWLSNEPASVSDDGSHLITLGNVYSVVK
jgi:pilus assembly protein CpaB